MTIHLGRPSPDASCDLPGRSAKTCLAVRRSANLSSLYGLAPGGVYNASSVAGAAVRSYRTLSPLPTDDKRASAVYFLLHFPWGRPRRALPGTVFPWSPDFPPLNKARALSRSDHPTVWRRYRTPTKFWVKYEVT